MSECISYKCDVCGAEKRESNHWWKGYVIEQDHTNEPSGIMIIPWNVTHFTRGFRSDTLPGPDAHLCGEQHAIQWASNNLTKKASPNAL